MTITLTVAGRIATVEADGHVVAGNTYPVTIALDSEWTGSLCLRVRFGSLYYDIPFASSATSVDVQMPVGYPEVGIGVFSEALEICTNEARVRLLRSILEAGEQVVDFDSDLYDQWAGEVTTLLTDDAFDAESTRPVQNAVLTAWKDTVPLDSVLVHKTGAETVGGNKTFTSDPTVTAVNYPVLKMDSQQDTSATGVKGEIRMMDRKNGSQSAVSLIQAITNSGYNVGRMSVYNPDKSQAHSIEVRSYSDHQLVAVNAPYYPVDGSSNPQALTANALVASGNIAVDPRLVHTTGNETIAGEKSFTSTLRAYKYRCEDATAYGSTQNKGALVFSAKNEQGVMTDYASAFLWQTLTGDTKGNSLAVHVRSLDGTRDIAPLSLKVVDADSYTTRVVVSSHLPVDAGGGHLAPESMEVINSSMLAVDPRVVHTTGNETVAGVKTFSNGIDAYPQNWHDVNKNGQAMGQYCIFATIPASTGVSGKFVQVDFVQSSNGGSVAGRMMFKVRLDGPDAMWVYRKSRGGNANINADAIHIVSDGTNLYLVSKRVATYGMLKCRVGLFLDYGTVQSTNTGITFHPQADMTLLDSLDGYTDIGIQEP